MEGTGEHLVGNGLWIWAVELHQLFDFGEEVVQQTFVAVVFLFERD